MASAVQTRRMPVNSNNFRLVPQELNMAEGKRQYLLHEAVVLATQISEQGDSPLMEELLATLEALERLGIPDVQAPVPEVRGRFLHLPLIEAIEEALRAHGKRMKWSDLLDYLKDGKAKFYDQEADKFAHRVRQSIGNPSQKSIVRIEAESGNDADDLIELRTPPKSRKN